jgi:hypothetical protein
LVSEGFPLSEVDSWDLEDIDKVNGILDMKADFEAAHSAFRSSEMESKLGK